MLEALGGGLYWRSTMLCIQEVFDSYLFSDFVLAGIIKLVYVNAPFMNCGKIILINI